MWARLRRVAAVLVGLSMIAAGLLGSFNLWGAGGDLVYPSFLFLLVGIIVGVMLVIHGLLGANLLARSYRSVLLACGGLLELSGLYVIALGLIHIESVLAMFTLLEGTIYIVSGPLLHAYALGYVHYTIENVDFTF